MFIPFYSAALNKRLFSAPVHAGSIWPISGLNLAKRAGSWREDHIFLLFCISIVFFQF